ncbi:ParB/RepB/Spo0J family partition protein [Niabella sp. CC-SYL272]|uniref:ParB/RepB/Spo0J family partition protein n=1 Tax=Niabella agricola TaxID=2891571 RepID=UPI001F31D8AA|nr:ParB/RepB/Spo0J family partition protein [Niabella agricola]MCF3109578.1 ParB/RepB/Spo0J family partition protein [Niabella agricola]
METTVNVEEQQSLDLSGLQPASAEEQVYNIPVSKIMISPKNYRKFYSEKAIEELAEQIAESEEKILHPIIVRQRGKKYELIVGERRYRAALRIGLKTMPARVRPLTDEVAKEIRLQENLQRENPHPLNEAEAIFELQDDGKTLAEISKKLGKSMAFIHNRIKLAELIDPLKELFVEDKITLQEAIELGSLARDSQEHFFEQHCANWKEEKHFSIGNFRYIIGHYRYDLKKAPFNTRDKKLVPDVGSCTGCPFNSATLKTLFPDMAKEAVCSNTSCFEAKRMASAESDLRSALESAQPAAILLGNYVNADLTVLLDSLPEAVELPRYHKGDVKIAKEPEKPNRERYTYEEGDRQVLSRERYSAALQEYREDLAAYREFVKLEATAKALLIQNNEIAPVYFNPELREECHREATQVTAKQVQEAIKEGTITEELLNGEIERIKTREDRKKEIDRERVQAKVHETFTAGISEGTLTAGLTAADTVGLRYVLYLALNYTNREATKKVLFPKGIKNNADFFDQLAALTDEQVAFLVRTIITGNSDSKTSRFMDAYCLYRMADEAGINVAEIEEQQKAEATKRQGNVKLRIKELKIQIKRLQRKAA